MSKNEQVIDVTILKKDVAFTVDRDKYNRFTNSLAGKRNLSQASHNLIVSTVDPDEKSYVLECIDENPGSETEIAGAIIEEYTPDLGIVAKKRKSTLSASSSTATKS